LVALILLVQALAGRKEKWQAREYAERDAELEAAFRACALASTTTTRSLARSSSRH